MAQGFDYAAILTPGGAAEGFSDLGQALLEMPGKKRAAIEARTAREEASGFRRQALANEYEQILMAKDRDTHNRMNSQSELDLKRDELAQRAQYQEQLLKTRQGIATQNNDTKVEVAGINAKAKGAAKSPQALSEWFDKRNQGGIILKGQNLNSRGKPDLMNPDKVIPFGSPEYQQYKQNFIESMSAADADEAAGQAATQGSAPLATGDLNQRVSAYLQQVPEAQRAAAQAELAGMAPDQIAAELDALGL